MSILNEEITPDEYQYKYEIIFYKICIAVFLFCLTFLFGYLPLKLEKFGKNYKVIGIANAFSGGVFLSISLLHLLPDSSDLFHDYFLQKANETDEEHHSHFPASYLLTFIGYTFILFIEKIVFDTSSGQEHKHHHREAHSEGEVANNSNTNNSASPRKKSTLEAEKIKSQSNLKNILDPRNTIHESVLEGKSSYADSEIHSPVKFLGSTVQLEHITEEGGNEPEGKVKKPGKDSSNVKFKSNNILPNLGSTDNIMRLNGRHKIETSKNLPLLRDDNLLVADFKSQNAEEYIETLEKLEEERNEMRFKKFFTSKGKFTSLAKEKFKNFKVRNEICEKTSRTANPVFDMREKVFDEIFEQTRPSLSEKELLLRREETKLFNKNNITSFLLLLALSIHAFFEGLALGLLDESREIFYLLIAISFHKWVEALSIGINLNKSNIEKEVLIVLIVMFSLTTSFGIILGIVLRGISLLFEAVFLAISAGTFLYISASEVIIEEFSVSRYKIPKFLGFLVGALIIFLFTVSEFYQKK